MKNRKMRAVKNFLEQKNKKQGILSIFKKDSKE